MGIRALVIGLLLTTVVACTSVAEPIPVTIEVEGPTDNNPPVVVTVRQHGPQTEETFAEEIEVIDESVEVLLPAPGSYRFEGGGVVAESTGPTSGCWWASDSLVVEIDQPTTVVIQVQISCA